MIQLDPASHLYERAEQVLRASTLEEADFNNQNLPDLVRELQLYQIALELQNEDLYKKQLELEESRLNYADLYELAPVGYYTLDENGIILESNQMGASLLGVKSNKLVAKSFTRYIAPNYQTTFAAFKERCLSETGIQRCELKLLNRNGPLFYAQVEGKIIVNLNKGKKQLLMTIADITHYQKNEQQNQYNSCSVDRMNSLGELTSYIITELTQPLSVISDYVYKCINHLEDNNFNPNHILQALKQASHQSQYTGEVISGIKSFISESELKKQPLCINQIMQEAINLINYELLIFSVNIQFTPIDQPPAVSLDKIHIQQVMLNLLRNAIDAMREHNTEDPMLKIVLSQPNNDFIEINVIDNGPGFSKDTQARLFEPHFTNKPYGIGLSLVASKNIIEYYGGKISAEANQGGGSCFKVLVPTYLP